MDVYEPEGDTLSERPAVVLAHGGSFIFGDKTDLQTTCELIASEGYVAISMQYRLYPVLVLGYPDSTKIMGAAMKAVGDMKAAVRFLRQDAAGNKTLRIDPEHIFIGGYSAGAVAALHAAYLDSTNIIPAFIQSAITANGGFEGDTGDAANHTFSSSTKATLSMSGGLYRASWLDAGEQPVASIHGTADATVYYTQGLAAGLAYLQGSSWVHARADTVGVWNSLTTVPGAGHTDLYSSANYASQLAAYFVTASAMMETLTCQMSSGTAVANTPVAEWSVYPNPMVDHLRIRLPEGWTNANLMVFNASGQRVLTQENVANEAWIATSAWPAGLYWAKIANPGQKQVVVAKMIVKQ
ncbi:MAG: T9SS type A sorting domain-containing protein [Lewinellaceae bacterium]|nr:T9SS type A sorting domain-containing protein [Lewinellaceae bacterium]